jgi:hypothetical protein
MNVRRLFPFALFTLLFATAIRPTIDPDMWWHLRTGEAILADGIPRRDLFSFTFPDNEWVTHEWLSEVLMWGLYQLGRLPALMLFFAGVTLVTWWLAYRLCAGKPYIAGMVVAFAAKASEVVWGSRPQLFNLALFGLFIYMLERRKDKAIGAWIFWTFPAIVLVWANLHSGYLLGIVVLGTYLVGEYAEGRRSRPDPRTLPPGDVRRLAVVIVAALLAALVNPNGARLWVYPFETLGSSVQRDFIAEWFPPAPDQVVFWLLLLLIVAGLFGFMKAARRPTATEVLVFGGTAFGAFLSVRNIPIFALAAAPIVARYLNDALPYRALRPDPDDDPSTRLQTIAAGAVITIGALVIAAGTLGDNDATIETEFPVAAVDWIEATGRADARIFNAYNYGGYLIWRGYPVYVDGRADVYGDEGLLQFGQTYFVRDDWQEPLDREAIDLVIVEANSALAFTLAEAPGWERVYEDPFTHVFDRALR